MKRRTNGARKKKLKKSVGDVLKDKEVVILSDEDEQAKSSATVSATTPPTLEQIT